MVLIYKYMFIVRKKIIFFVLSILFVLASLFAMFRFGFNFGIDFTGGSILQLTYLQSDPNIEEIKNDLSSAGMENLIVSPVGQSSVSIKSKTISQDQKNLIIQKLSRLGDVPLKEDKFNSIGPAIGNELKSKAYVAIFVVILCIVLYIMFAFRKLKNPFHYGVATIIALIHDVIVSTGAYIYWISYKGGEIDILFVTAILAILGYSVHDTIVVFDRVRENLLLKGKENFEDTVGLSIKETFGRSINTSVTIFLSLVALYFIGSPSTHNFSFVLLVGVVVGTYSSIFLASPLLIVLNKFKNK